MSPEYGMLITVAVIFIPAGLAFLWVTKRSERRKKHETGCSHITPAGGNVFLDLGFEPEEAENLKADSDRIIAEKKANMQAKNP